MGKSRPILKWRICGLEVYTPLFSYNFDTDNKIKGFYKQGILQFIGKWNWYTFQLFECTFEYEPYGPLYSWRFHILGFGWYVGINPPWETKQSKHIQERCDEAKNSKYFYKSVRVKNPNYKKGKNGK